MTGNEKAKTEPKQLDKLKIKLGEVEVEGRIPPKIAEKKAKELLGYYLGVQLEFAGIMNQTQPEQPTSTPTQTQTPTSDEGQDSSGWVQSQ